MAFSKHHLYPKEDQATSYFAKAFSHPARITILRQLLDNGPLTVQVIAEKHPITLETISNHLLILRQAHLVECEEVYPYTFYWIHERNLQVAIDFLEMFFVPFKRQVSVLR